jgi:hypothetical protein
MKTKLLLLTLTLAATTAPLVRADLPPLPRLPNISINADIRLGRQPPPPPPAVVVVVEDTRPRGQLVWERRSWYQRNQSYMYYPGYDVYYRPSDRLWFYSDRGQWRSARNLPEYVRIDFDRSVTLTMATDRPYQFHQQVTASYPANYFGTKVRLRDERRNNDQNGRDNNNNGRDQNNDDSRGRDKNKDDHDNRR